MSKQVFIKGNEIATTEYVNEAITNIPKSDENPIFTVLDGNFSQTSKPFRFPKYKKGIYLFPDSNYKNVYFSTKETGTGSTSIEILNGVLYVLKGLGDTIEDRDTVGIIVDYRGYITRVVQMNGNAALSGISEPINGNLVYDKQSVTFQRQIMFGGGLMATSASFIANCPQCDVSPTENNHLVNKSYVDNAISEALASINAEVESIKNGNS